MADGTSRKQKLYFRLLAQEFSDVVAAQWQPLIGLTGFGPHVGRQFKDRLASGGKRKATLPHRKFLKNDDKECTGMTTARRWGELEEIEMIMIA